MHPMSAFYEMDFFCVSFAVVICTSYALSSVVWDERCGGKQTNFRCFSSSSIFPSLHGPEIHINNGENGCWKGSHSSSSVLEASFPLKHGVMSWCNFPIPLRRDNTEPGIQSGIHVIKWPLQVQLPALIRKKSKFKVPQHLATGTRWPQFRARTCL